MRATAVKLILILLATMPAIAQSPYSVNIFRPGTTISASGVTSAATNLGTVATVPKGGSWASYTIQLTGVGLTTATVAVQGSTDNGTTWVTYPMCTIAVTPSCALTQTATAATSYTLTYPNLTQIRFVSSSTFTATSINLLITANPNATVSKNGSSSGGSVSFDQITSGTNLAHGLVCGAGCVESTAGNGIINANELNGVLLSGLATGLMKNTTATGVPSIATPCTDYAGLGCANTFSAENTFPTIVNTVAGGLVTTIRNKDATGNSGFNFNDAGNANQAFFGFSNASSGFHPNTLLMDVFAFPMVFCAVSACDFTLSDTLATFLVPVTATAVNVNRVSNGSSQTVVNCATSGTATFSQPEQGSSYKVVMVHVAACLGAASYTFPTAFSFAPQVVAQTLTSLAGTPSTTAVTITGTTSTGFLELNGY